MNERVFGPHDPDWTKEHQEASEPTERELLLIKQRDEARTFAEEACRKYNELLEEKRKVTCVYCGWEYPKGTPLTQDAVLSVHMEGCPKHPLRKAREELIVALGKLEDAEDSKRRAVEALRAQVDEARVELVAGWHAIECIKLLHAGLGFCCVEDGGAAATIDDRIVGEALKRLKEAEQFVETQWRAAQRARERYTAEHPGYEGWPDRADLLVWLMEQLEEAQRRAEMLREKVVWGFYEEELPQYIQGKAGENELCQEVTAADVSDLAARLRAALERAEKAERLQEEIKALREALRKLWYLRVPTGMKLEEMLLEIGHKKLWHDIYPLVEPKG